MEKRTRNPRTSEKQFDAMLEFISAHKVIITGKLTPGEGPQKIQLLWEQLTTELNSLGNGPVKTVDGWKKTWNEYKAHTKKKARDIRVAQLQTGGGEAKGKHLSDRDERLLSLISRVTVDGLADVDEPGIHSTENVAHLVEANVPHLVEANVPTVRDAVPSTSFAGTPPAKKRRLAVPTAQEKLGSSAERATEAYAQAMAGRNAELAANTTAITQMATAIDRLAAAMESIANSIEVNLNRE